MTTTRKPLLRAFPISNPLYIAVSAVKNDPDNQHPLGWNLSYEMSYEIKRGVNSSNKSVTTSSSLYAHKSNAQPFILPNGYYFHDQEYWTSDDMNHAKNHVVLGNIVEGHSNNDDCNADIDPSLGAIIQDSPTKLQIAGITRDGKKVFLYHFSASSAFYIDMPDTEFQQIRNAGAEITRIENIFSLENVDTHIVSIAGFPQLQDNKCLMAIAYNSGDIILGEIADNKFTPMHSLSTPLYGAPEKVQLLSTPQGLLIAHYPNENKMRIWDVANNLLYTEYKCPNMYNLSVSIDGKYLTAMDYQGGEESNRVHCFELNPFKYKLIHLDGAAADFVIGQDNQVCILRRLDGDKEICKREFPGTIDKFLTSKIGRLFDRIFHPNQDANVAEKKSFR